MVQRLLLSQQEIANDFNNNSDVILHLGDSLEFLETLPSSLITLIITSPPYNIGKIYEKRASLEDYLETQESVIKELVRILHDSGSICWQVGNYVLNRESYPLDIYLFLPNF